MNIWKTIGSGFVSTGKGAISVGLWASQHPQVIASAAAIAAHPSLRGVLTTIAAVSDGARVDVSGRTMEGP